MEVTADAVEVHRVLELSDREAPVLASEGGPALPGIRPGRCRRATSD